MTAVLLGSNRFVDCDTIVGLRGKPLLRTVTGPLRVTLVTPEETPSCRTVRLVDGMLESPGEHARVVASEQSISLFWDDALLLVATLLEAGTVHVKIDLRPVGLNIYDDVEGLHIGGNVLSGNVVERSAMAIHLA